MASMTIPFKVIKKRADPGIIISGKSRIMSLWDMNCSRVNTIMNVNKYRLRGNSHNKGMAARSVVMNTVKPNIKLEGTKEVKTQNPRAFQEGRRIFPVGSVKLGSY